MSEAEHNNSLRAGVSVLIGEVLMSIFICWSRDRSHDLASAVKTLLESTLPGEDVFVSDRIEKGVAWFDAIVQHLQSSKVGIVCLTPENVNSPWLHFEAGALALRLTREPLHDDRQDVASARRPGTPRHRLFTLLHGVTGAALEGPLSAYQATNATRLEMGDMIRSIANVLGKSVATTGQGVPIISDNQWMTFEDALDKVMVPARKLVPDLQSLFQRKTFNEPLHRCADQAWIRRYDGARLTHEKLVTQLDQVRAACSAHERGLFEMLLSELDGYAMAIQALLLSPKRFDLGQGGELTMDVGIQTCCEDRRLAIRSLAALLLHPLGRPLLEEAVRFMGAETHEERKMIVHRLEGTIRREWEKASKRADHDGALNELTRSLKTAEFRESSWDLDRIYYYLLIQYFGAWALRSEPAVSSVVEDTKSAPYPIQRDLLCAARDVEMEVERYRAKSKGGSLMPLTYALVALQELCRKAAPEAEAGAAVISALEIVRNELGEKLLTSDAGRPIDRLVKQMLSSDASGARPVAK